MKKMIVLFMVMGILMMNGCAMTYGLISGGSAMARPSSSIDDGTSVEKDRI